MPFPEVEAAKKLFPKIGFGFQAAQALWAVLSLLQDMQNENNTHRKGAFDQAMTILEEALKIVRGDRNDSYGCAFHDFSRTGIMAGALLHEWAKEAAKSETPIPLPPELVGLFMVCVKISREVNRHKNDNIVDGAGYFQTVADVHEYREKKTQETQQVY